MILSFAQKKIVLTRLAVSEGADWPRAEFLIRTRLVCSTEPGHEQAFGKAIAKLICFSHLSP